MHARHVFSSYPRVHLVISKTSSLQKRCSNKNRRKFENSLQRSAGELLPKEYACQELGAAASWGQLSNGPLFLLKVAVFQMQFENDIRVLLRCFRMLVNKCDSLGADIDDAGTPNIFIAPTGYFATSSALEPNHCDGQRLFW